MGKRVSTEKGLEDFTSGIAGQPSEGRCSRRYNVNISFYVDGFSRCGVTVSARLPCCQRANYCAAMITYHFCSSSVGMYLQEWIQYTNHIWRPRRPAMLKSTFASTTIWYAVQFKPKQNTGHESSHHDLAKENLGSTLLPKALAKRMQHVGATCTEPVACVWPPCCAMLPSSGQPCSTFARHVATWSKIVASVWAGLKKCVLASFTQVTHVSQLFLYVRMS